MFVSKSHYNENNVFIVNSFSDSFKENIFVLNKNKVIFTC